MKPFTFTIPNFKDGLAPGYWKNDYPKHGNLSHAGKAKSINIFDQGYLGPGMGTSVLTNGTQAGIHTELITAIDIVKGQYAGGGKYVHKIDNYGLVNTGDFPHEITAPLGVSSFEDIITYQENIYYSYRYGYGVGRIGRYTLVPYSSVESSLLNVDATGWGPPFGESLSMGNQKFAQSFTGITGTIKSIKLVLNKYAGNPTDSIKITIQTNSGGNPSGSVVGGAGYISSSEMTSYGQEYKIFLGSGASVVTGSIYHIVLERTGSLDKYNCYGVTGSTSNVYANGSLKTLLYEEHEPATWGYPLLLDQETQTVTRNANCDISFEFLTSTDSIPAGFDDDFMSVVPTGYSDLYGSRPNIMCVAPDTGRLYITNGKHVASYLGYHGTNWINSFDEKKVFLDHDFRATTIIYCQNLIWTGGSMTNSTGKIFVWDGDSENLDDVIEVTGGVVGALFVIGNSPYVIYRTSYYGVDKEICWIALINGNKIQNLISFEGTLPTHHDVTNFEGGVAIKIDGDVYFLGQSEPGSNPVFFPITATDYSDTIGCIKNTPLGFFLSSKDSGSNISISHIPEIAGLIPVYKTDGHWKGIITSSESEKEFFLKELIVRFSKLVSGQSATIKVNYNNGSEITKTISFALDGPVTKKIIPINQIMENFRVEIYWTGGSTSSPLYIKNITAKGHYQETK